MLGWLYRKLIGRFGCNHNYTVYTVFDIKDEYGAINGKLYVQICKNCGHIKEKKIQP